MHLPLLDHQDPLGALQRGGVGVTRGAAMSTSTSFAINGIDVPLGNTSGETYQLTLPGMTPLEVMFARETLAKQAAKLFGKELQTGDKAFDDAVFITTSDEAPVAQFLMNPEVKALLRTFVEHGGSVAISGASVQIQALSDGPVCLISDLEIARFVNHVMVFAGIQPRPVQPAAAQGLAVVHGHAHGAMPSAGAPPAGYGPAVPEQDHDIARIMKARRNKRLGVVAAIILVPLLVAWTLVPMEGAVVRSLEDRGYSSIQVERQGIFEFSYSAKKGDQDCSGSVKITGSSERHNSSCTSVAGLSDLPEVPQPLTSKVVEERVAKGMADDAEGWGTSVDSVTCPADRTLTPGSDITCTATLADGTQLTLKIERQETSITIGRLGEVEEGFAGLHWTYDGQFIAIAKIETKVLDFLKEKGRAAHVLDCGQRLWFLSVGATRSCKFSYGPAKQKAEVSVTIDDLEDGKVNYTMSLR